MYDCVVVGGGLIGMMSARQLAIEGLSVLLLDQGRLGQESSWAGGGILSPLYPWRYAHAVSKLAVYSARYYEALAQALKQESGVDPQWTRSGLLILDAQQKSAAQQWAQDYQQELQLVTHDTLVGDLQPGLHTQADEALWFPAVAQLRNPRLVKSLHASLQYHGVDFAEGEAVIECQQDKGRVVAVRTAERTIPTERVIVTAGAWSAPLLEQAGAQVAVEPVRGQMLVFAAVPELLQHIVLERGRYLIPRRDGHVLIGSTLEREGFDKSTTAQARDELKARALEMLPALASYPIERHWAGLRPGSPHGIPYIGQHPGLDGLYFNCGHYRNGVILGLASVQLLTDLLLGRDPIVDPVPYALDAEH